jgi:RNA polymerase sigma factor (sigma-70 family)
VTVTPKLSAAVLRVQGDERLAALAGAGSEGAFEALVHRYRRPLLAYCRRLLLPEARAEDVVQQAFVSAWSSLNSGTEVDNVKAWLYRITHNQAINALKRSGYDFEELSDSLRGADAPEADLERRTVMRETLAGLAALPELQREAILRTAVNGDSYEQVASALGISDTQVRGLVYRARLTLRTGLGVLIPGPLVAWAAGSGRRAAGPLLPRLAELVAGSGSAGGVAVAIKGGAVVATSAVVLGGAVAGVVHSVASHPRHSNSHLIRSAVTVPRSAGAVTSAPADDHDGSRAAVTDALRNPARFAQQTARHYAGGYFAGSRPGSSLLVADGATGAQYGQSPGRWPSQTGTRPAGPSNASQGSTPGLSRDPQTGSPPHAPTGSPTDLPNGARPAPSRSPGPQGPGAHGRPGRDGSTGPVGSSGPGPEGASGPSGPDGADQ